MYKCGICHCTSTPRHPMLKHVIYRDLPFSRFVNGEVVRFYRKEIDQEIPVCKRCKLHLDVGLPLTVVRHKFGPKAKPPTPKDPTAPRPVLVGRAALAVTNHQPPKST